MTLSITTLCHYAECLFAACHYAECPVYIWFIYWYAECLSAVRPFVTCRYDECHYDECRVLSLLAPFWPASARNIRVSHARTAW
jgi:hypothetical protein